MRQFGLHDDARMARVGDVHAGEVLRRAFMRHPQHAPAARGDLKADALADIAEARQRVVREQPKVIEFMRHVGLDPSSLPLPRGMGIW